MKTRESTIGKEFDDPDVKFSIPEYQRTYSWEKHNFEDFYTDIEKASKSENKFFFGTIMLKKEDNICQVIDGQQRLTTIVIFLSVIRKVITDASKKKELEKYVENKEGLKFDPRLDNTEYFKEIIGYNNSKSSRLTIETLAQRCMKEVHDFFSEKMENLEGDQLAKYIEVIESSIILIVEVEEDKDGALLFELNNNRGKSFTDLEKLKSGFMLLLYLNSKQEETDKNVNDLNDIFKRINNLAQDIEPIDKDSKEEKFWLWTDDVLKFHNFTILDNHFGYRKLDEVYKKVIITDNQEKLIDNIFTYSNELLATFQNVAKFKESNYPIKEKFDFIQLMNLGWVLVIVAYRESRNGEDEEKLKNYLNVIEKIIFRDRCIRTRKNLSENFKDEQFTKFIENSKIEDLFESIGKEDWKAKNCQSDFIRLDYWKKKEKALITYIMQEYEDYLQEQSNSNYSSTKILNNRSVEHIAPQTDGKDWSEEPGYETENKDCKWQYTEDFKDNYLNKIGNLALLTQGENSTLSNKPFKEKKNTIQDSDAFKLNHIIEIFENNEEWKIEQIQERTGKLLKFAKERWNFKEVKNDF